MGEMRALCVSLPNEVKYEFSYICDRRVVQAFGQEAPGVLSRRFQASERGLAPLATMTCDGVRQRVYCAS
jgi:hypothetical protein